MSFFRDLTSDLVSICSIPANPVPATIRIRQRHPSPDGVHRVIRNCLRVENDDIIGIRPHVVPGIRNELASNHTVALQTAMQGDMQLANSRRPRLACLGDIQISSRIHAASTVLARLAERHNGSRQCASISRI